MTLTEKLILTALKFRAVKLWDKLDDKMIFGVMLPDGDTMYCCVMGNAGEHYALGTYKGAKGFATYLKTLTLGGLDTLEQFETTMAFDCINVEYVNADDRNLSTELKAEIKEVVKDNGLKMNRPNGWPTFVKMQYATHTFSLDVENDIINVTAALEGALEVASKVKGLNWIELDKLGFQVEDLYPSDKGGMKIPLLIRNDDGTYTWSTTVTPPLYETPVYPVIFSDTSLASALKKIKHAGTLQVKALHTPAPVGNRDCMIFPLMMLCIDKNTGKAFPVMNINDDSDTRLGLINSFASLLFESKNIPATIEVFDQNTQTALADFCKKTGIMLVRGKDSDMIDNACEQLFYYMRNLM
ncbi:MAG: hypothetical protein NC098_01700 [Lachnoclostridium sp.]|nr:hypothetical protein [Lachnoclostridium sp.]